MNRTDIISNVKDWLVTITGLSANRVIDEDSKEVGSFTGKTRVIVSLTSTTTKGRDEESSQDIAGGPAGADRAVYVHGKRNATIGIRVETADQRPGYTAADLINTIRNRLFAPSARAHFRLAQYAINSVAGDIPLNLTIGERRYSVMRLDVLINATSFIEDDPTTYISTVEVTPESDFTKPDGTKTDYQISGKINIDP